MMEVEKEGFQFLTVTDAFVRPGLEETLQSEEFLGRKAGDEKASIQLDAQEIITVLGPSTFSRASGIPRLEAEDLMELRLLWHSLELGTPAVK